VDKSTAHTHRRTSGNNPITEIHWLKWRNALKSGTNTDTQAETFLYYGIVQRRQLELKLNKRMIDLSNKEAVLQ
jgi:hypothetical protein